MSEGSEHIQAVVLRFRDLATGEGETIRLHHEICCKHDAVWWAWWKKSGETVPGDTFRRLIDKLPNVRFFLFDSGQHLLYPAECSKIEWSADHKPVASPEKSLTPTYYCDQKYVAWFRLTRIDEPVENAERTLQEHTYLEVSELFESKKSQYDIFYGKQVRSLAELKQQDRTVWFLRGFLESDRTNDVMLLQAKQVEPAHFPEEYASSQSTHLLWVSDLHFSSAHHAFPKATTPNTSPLALAIEHTAKAHQVEDFAGVLVSGDLTWKATEDEFGMFRGFLGQMLRSPSSLDTYRLAICPGNHDLAFTATPQNKAAAISDEINPDAARAEYARLYRDLFYLAPNEYLAMGRRYLLGKHFPLEVACLNSSLLEQKKDWFQGQGFVGQQQLDAVAEGMGWKTSSPNTAPRAFRVVMMHHHLVPVSYASEPWGGVQYSVVLDAGRLRRWLEEHQVDLLLHGHMHEDFVTELTRPDQSQQGPLRVVGLGSTGVTAGHRGQQPNVFGVLTAERNELRVRTFEVSPDGSSGQGPTASRKPRTDYRIPQRLVTPGADRRSPE